jgi:hypothetical protein
MPAKTIAMRIVDIDYLSLEVKTNQPAMASGRDHDVRA